jgi:ribosome modulation factor
VRTYYSSLTVGGKECRFDSGLRWASNGDYHDGRERFERCFYRAGIAQASAAIASTSSRAVDQVALQRLVQLEASRPDPAAVQAYKVWTRAVLPGPQGAAGEDRGNVARGVFDAEDLRELAPHDPVLFDQALQVSLLRALALAQLGRRGFRGRSKAACPDRTIEVQKGR